MAAATVLCCLIAYCVITCCSDQAVSCAAGHELVEHVIFIRLLGVSTVMTVKVADDYRAKRTQSLMTCLISQRVIN